ncbi:MAG: hypothetical protein V5A55_00715 [Halovenus sp.]
MTTLALLAPARRLGPIAPPGTPCFSLRAPVAGRDCPTRLAGRSPDGAVAPDDALLAETDD